MIRHLGRSEREYWTQFGNATYERREKRTSDLITKLSEKAGQLLANRRR